MQLRKMLQDLRLVGDELRQTSRSNEVMAWLKLEQFRDAAELCTAARLQGMEGRCSPNGDTCSDTKEILNGGAPAFWAIGC